MGIGAGTGALLGGLASAGGGVGSAAMANGKQGEGIPGEFQPIVEASLGNLHAQLQNPATPYMLPTVAPMSPFEIAALGQISEQALNPANAITPTTQVPTFRPLNDSDRATV